MQLCSLQPTFDKVIQCYLLHPPNAIKEPRMWRKNETQPLMLQQLLCEEGEHAEHVRKKAICFSASMNL